MDRRWYVLCGLAALGLGACEPDGADADADDGASVPEAADADADDGACGPDDWCMVDFPCDHPSSRSNPMLRETCVDGGRMMRHNVPCERACHTPCCGGAGCELVFEPCEAGSECVMVDTGPVCNGATYCGAITTFADAGTPSRLLFVDPDGDDLSGDGSMAHPFASLGRAAREATPGTTIRLNYGTYPGDQSAVDLQGDATAPIFIQGWGSVVISGGADGIHLVNPRWVVLQWLTVEGQTTSGIRIDDGGDVATPAEQVVLRHVTIRDVGTGGTGDCVKLSGVDHFFVLDGTFESCGAGGDSGSGIDVVGCHDGLVARNSFQAMGDGAVRARGGSSAVTIRANRIIYGGARALSLGGSTDPSDFRPAGADYEARNLLAFANVIYAAEAAVAFVGCDGCLFANNTIVDPSRWVARILQESVDGFVPCRDGRFVNNLVLFRSTELADFVDVGPDTAPETFVFSNDLWFAEDDASFAGPTLPVAEEGTVVADPLTFGPGADWQLRPGSPATGAGVALPDVVADYRGLCWDDPPAIGASEGT